ncbi:hypothetical protein H0H92_014669 [Tricholoma furcatifolium]|nr:hypothetical protein H0H92_014669 [Tricholoma furcatifolium]
MSILNNSENIEINDSSISTVAGNQNIAENMIIYQNSGHPDDGQDFRKRGRQPSSDDANTNLIVDVDKGVNFVSGPGITRPPPKKTRFEDDRANTGSYVSELMNNIGGDAYIAGTLQQNNIFQGSDATVLSKLHVAKGAGPAGSKACIPGTRVALLERIYRWALDPSGQRTLLLNGAGGMGKSAIAHTVARQLESSGDAIVPFFAFNRSIQERSSSQL